MGAGAGVLSGGDGNVSADDLLQYVNTVNKVDCVPSSHFNIRDKRMVVGRIIPHHGSQLLLAPISRRPCVYYKIIVHGFNQGMNQWIPCVTEVKKENFFLGDGIGQHVLVPFQTEEVTFYGKEDRGQEFLMAEPHQFQFLHQLLERNGQNMAMFQGFRYNEAACEIGEQIGILGKGEESPEGGVKIGNFSDRDFGNGWYKEHHFNHQEEAMWENLTRTRDLIVTDDPRFLRVQIPPFLIPGLNPQAIGLGSPSGIMPHLEFQQPIGMGGFPQGQQQQMQQTVVFSHQFCILLKRFGIDANVAAGGAIFLSDGRNATAEAVHEAIVLGARAAAAGGNPQQQGPMGMPVYP